MAGVRLRRLGLCSATAIVALLVAACSSTTAGSIAPRTSPSATPPKSAITSPDGAPSAAAPSPTPLPAGPDVPLGGLVDAADGWAVTDQRLLVTADGGSTWRDATPPGGFATTDTDRLLGVDFVDARHGWVAVNEAFTSASDPKYGRVDIWHTTDGGHSWAKTQRPSARFAAFGEIMPGVQFDFLDALHGFAFQSGNLAKGKNDSDLFWTADGGATWSADRPTGDGSLGNEGNVGFASATDGVIVNAAHGSGIVVTHDGGRTWSDAALALPPGSGGTQLFFGQPVFFGGSEGLVAVDLQSEEGAVPNVTRVYRTSDGGSTWSLASTLPTGGIPAVAFLDPHRWIATNGTDTARTTDGGLTWRQGPTVGLPGYTGSLLMADAQHGWALVSMAVCLSFKSDCSSRTGLYATADGGSTWAELWPK